ncbi:methylated-DNA--[protein]-cysteine S-methyltransferase [Propylenella binzhouense]|uniref:Methylated-DNA--[protein]-cysteine S-methyltransferase n=1 Tax=Propylenella binzhouense TaxID=2555902 RepID=A0A964T3V3_9HYPH|nr:methylated-DNA--[protein]-cysteine S-methyltransferase [Propylenella binzhouense]MYZ48001.1 methylated-DNA--[protein]-cysteine S-methyltransferase [Propylenella binzhouense]
MDGAGFALFDTAIGRCGIAWGPRGIRALCLPDASEAKTRARLRRRSGAPAETEPPPPVRDAIGRIGRLLAGEPVDLEDVAIDLAGEPDFHRAVYALARRIPPGATRTYGDLAKELGDIALARAVGQALGRNPVPLVVPCHRVLGAGGRPGGFSAPGGLATKLHLLAVESRHGAAPLLPFATEPAEAPRQG